MRGKPRESKTWIRVAACAIVLLSAFTAGALMHGGAAVAKIKRTVNVSAKDGGKQTKKRAVKDSGGKDKNAAYVLKTSSSESGKAVSGGKNSKSATAVSKKDDSKNSPSVRKKRRLKKKKSVSEVSFIMVGDNLIHDSVLHAGKQKDGSYDFSELYQKIRKDIKEADLAVINQETILGGSEFGYSGYPNFNSPYAIGDAIIDAGFDVVLQASNHSFDKGERGVRNCLAYWSRHPQVKMIGINSSREQNKIRVIRKNKIKIAVLNYTYGLNGYRLPKGKEYLVNLIDEDRIVSDIKKAEKIADFTIVFPHWGVEYVYTPNAQQKNLAWKMTEAGADLIVGAHPHVLQSISRIKTKNGNKSLCYYSLGNFTSGQERTDTVLGGMAKLTIIKKNGKTRIKKGAGIVPLVTHYEWGLDRVQTTYKLSDYTEKLAKSHSIRTVTGGFSLSRLKSLANQIVGKWIVEQ